ncbi:hypothetical protein [Ruminiclostridium cellulolyticum]|uniref:Uncharacterized protein n=1 Tax=Ruminiclostridium cellulolyticum (strain ATCC 35319 / DSM 5812 / JCM 6584 / H10) TaxID=394503 RepID=B8I4M0_RUMCH|nr:hypothetical protein [Ruminiclostridium cellulolyticum]ACL74574.1 hypothetical protein Ccel_0187 [Ruminiclostridium cellulolyticum H10]
MCIRITLIFENIYDEVSINSVAKSYDRRFKIVNNPIILSQLPDGERWFESAYSSCECSTGIGSFELFTRNVENVIEQLKDKSIAEEVRTEEVKRKSMYKKDVDNWGEFIKSLIRKYNFKRVGLLMHFTDDDLARADFLILDKYVVKYSDINPEVLMKIKNELYIILWIIKLVKAKQIKVRNIREG